MLKKKIKVRHFAGTGVGARLVPTLDPLGPRVRRVFVDFTDTDRHEYTTGKVRTLQRGGRRGGGRRERRGRDRGETGERRGRAQTHTQTPRIRGDARSWTRERTTGEQKEGLGELVCRKSPGRSAFTSSQIFMCHFWYL